MQPIERYALVTLLFLVVLVVVVAMWDDGSAESAPPGGQDVRDTTVATRVEESRARTSDSSRRTLRDGRRAAAKPPVNGPDDSRVPPRIRTRTDGAGAHSVLPGGAAPRDPELGPSGRPRAATPEELAGLLEPIKPRSGAESGPNMLDRTNASGSRRSGNGGMLNSPYLDGRDDRAARGPSAAGPSGTSARGSRANTPPRPPSSTPPRTQPRTNPKPAPALPSPDRTRPAPSTGTRTYTIRSGDSLERIARRELPGARTNDAVEEIARLNALSKPYRIYAGDELKLPSSTSLPAAAAASGSTRPASATDGRSTYTVRSGDVLSSVLVARYGTYKRSIALVTKLNPGLDPDVLRAGSTIVMPRPDEIPGGVSAPAAASASASAAPRRSTSGRSTEYVVR
ncbi:MAG: LysM peptidoglycan-binding domain-containing protein [Planctomycetota bacterium]